MFLAERLGFWLPEKRDLWRPSVRSPIRIWNGRVWNPRREDWEDVLDARYEEIVAMLTTTNLSSASVGGGAFTAVTYTGTGVQSNVSTAIPTGASALVCKGTGAGGGGDHRGNAATDAGGGGGGGAYFQSASLTVTSADYGKSITCNSDAGAPVTPRGQANGPRSASTSITSTGTSFGNLSFRAEAGFLANSTTGGSASNASNSSTGAALTGATLTSGSAGFGSSGTNGGNGGAAAGPFAGAAGVGGSGTIKSGTSGGNYGSGGGGAADSTAANPGSAGGGGDGRTDLVFT